MKTEGLESLLFSRGPTRTYVTSPPPVTGAFQGNTNLKRDIIRGIEQKFPELERHTKLNVIHRIYMHREKDRDILTGAVKSEEYSEKELGLNGEMMIYLNWVYDVLGEYEAVRVMKAVGPGASLPDLGTELTKLRVRELQAWCTVEMKGRGKNKYVDAFAEADTALSLTDPDRRRALNEVVTGLKELRKTTTLDDRFSVADAGIGVIQAFQKQEGESGRLPERRKELLFATTLSSSANALFFEKGTEFEANWVRHLLRND